jgi:hypothetical protein
MTLRGVLQLRSDDGPSQQVGIRVWIPLAYPEQAPIPYVVPTATETIARGHTCVTADGRCNLAYCRRCATDRFHAMHHVAADQAGVRNGRWSTTSSLLGVLSAMVEQLSQEQTLVNDQDSPAGLIVAEHSGSAVAINFLPAQPERKREPEPAADKGATCVPTTMEQAIEAGQVAQPAPDEPDPEPESESEPEPEPVAEPAPVELEPRSLLVWPMGGVLDQERLERIYQVDSEPDEAACGMYSSTMVGCTPEQVAFWFAQKKISRIWPAPPSPMSGRTFASSNFRIAYAKASAPTDLMSLGMKLGTLIRDYCHAHGIVYDDDEGEQFFDELRANMEAGSDDSMPEAVQRMWTSFRQLHGCEFCGILNEATRDDAPDRIASAAALTRAINRLCVMPDDQEPQGPFPPDFVCFRGGGFDDQYRSFFVPGREFRQPAFLATSFLESTAETFIGRSTMPSKAKWLVRIDPEYKCRHVNLVTRRVADLEDEQEYLFAPYSAFRVLSTNWNTGTSADPHVIELLAAPDNKAVSEHLPLAPWS